MRSAPVASLLVGTGGVPGDAAPIEGRLDGDRILVPVVTSDVAAITDQFRVATSIARATGGSLHAVDTRTTSNRPPPETRRPVTTDGDGALLDWAVERASASQRERRLPSARGLVDGVLNAARANDVDTLVLPGTSSTGRLRRNVTRRLAHRVDCDVVTVNGRRGYEGVPSVLLAVAGGPHSGLATDVARHIAADCNAWIDVLHVVAENASERERRRAESYVDAAYRRIARPESTTTWILEAESVADAIVEQSSYYELTVVGAPTKGRLRRFISESTTGAVRSDANSVVISARSNGEADDGT